MEIFWSISIIFLSISIFLFFGVKKEHFVALLNIFQNKEKTLKQEMKNKDNPILGFINKTGFMLDATGQKGKLSFVIILSLILMAVGILIAITIGNAFLIPVASIGFGLVPFIYIRFQFIAYNKLVVEELSTAMSSVTTSYERTENILLAFKENVNDVHEPIRSIFESFINEMENVNPNYEKALDNMKNKLNNTVWVEWCEAFKRCSRNRTIKFVLAPIVTKLTKIAVVTADLQTILMNAVKDFWVLMGAAFALLYVGVFVLPQGIMIEIPETLSNILIAVNVSVGLILSLKVSLITREIKFDL